MNIKLKTCRICKEKYKPFSTISRTCSISCAIVDSKRIEQKKLDKAFNKRKRTFKDNDVKLRKKAAQTAFNAYIRARDEGEACISCQRHHKGQIHAGHYKTTAARPDLKFNEDNCHSQCAPCNNHLSGNIENYRPNLIEKIGRERFDKLELEKSVKYSAQDYKEIELMYKQKLKDHLYQS